MVNPTSNCGKEWPDHSEENEIKREDKFLVFNMKFITELSDGGKRHLGAMVRELSEKFPHAKDNLYVCCNQDEPYAEKVWEIILEGERKKLVDE